MEGKEEKQKQIKRRRKQNHSVLKQGLSGQVALETVSCLFIIFKEAGFHVWF